MPRCVTPKPKFIKIVLMIIQFYILGNNHIFEQIAFKSIFSDLIFILDFQQMTQQSRIIKIQFRRFDDSFVKIIVQGLQQKHNITAFQCRQPRLCGGLRNTTILGEIIQVQQMAGTSGTQTQKHPERTQILYVYQIGNIPFNIRLNVTVIEVF